MWERARRVWPGIEIPERAFLDYALARFSTSQRRGQKARAPEDAHADLYLTCACAAGNTLAIVRFEERYRSLFERIRSRFGALAPSLDEVLADVRLHLFAPREHAPPRIAEYAGWVDLGAWLKVVTTRLLLDRRDAQRPEEPYEDLVLERLRITFDTPETATIKAEGRKVFRAALRHAIDELKMRDRQVLCLAFADGLTIDDLSRLYHVHRTTTFRWLERASERLSANLRRIVRQELGLSEDEYERWCAELRSQLEISVERYLTGSKTVHL